MKIQRPNIKINKTWLMLVVAIALSIFTIWLTMQYLQSREQSIEAEIAERTKKNQGETVAVVVPVKPLSPGTLLEENLVASRNVPQDFVYEDTVTVAQFEAFKGQALIRGVERGRPLRRADVREVFADFSGILQTGRRAMTIAVDEINSVAHMIEPGNLVDLMLVLTPSGNDPMTGQPSQSSQTVTPFLDQIRVLATGQKVTHDDPAEQNSPERRRTYSNLTLEVTPTQAARLTLALELGKIRAILRNEKDKQSVDYETVTANNLMEDIRERERRAAMARPRTGPSGPSGHIEYFIGGKGNSDAPVAPVINVPMPAGMMPGMPTAAAAAPADASAQPAIPTNLNDLLKLSAAANKAAPSK